MRYLLNSAVVPSAGAYRYCLIAIDQAAAWLRQPGWVSRIGYPATAAHLYAIAGISVPISRERTEMAPGDEALVVRLKYRIGNPEDKRTFQPAPDDWEYGLLRKVGEYHDSN